MNSPGHRQNVLSTSAVELGCGASFFWQNGFPAFKAVQNFQFFEPVRVNNALSRAAEPAPSAPPTRRSPAPVKQQQIEQVEPPQHALKTKTKVTTTQRGNQTIRKTIITRERDGYTETEEIVEITTH